MRSYSVIYFIRLGQNEWKQKPPIMMNMLEAFLFSHAMYSFFFKRKIYVSFFTLDFFKLIFFSGTTPMHISTHTSCHPIPCMTERGLHYQLIWRPLRVGKYNRITFALRLWLFLFVFLRALLSFVRSSTRWDIFVLSANLRVLMFVHTFMFVCRRA